MPGFISHTVMASEVYERINKKMVNKDYMITYSLGADLTKGSVCRWATHHVKQEEFIRNMADYIKDNNLINDKELMGVLYGHICHYIMDDEIHPLVRMMDHKCIKNKKNHMLIELYYDKYLVNNRLNMKIPIYVHRLLIAKTNKKVKDMLNNVYYKTYGVERITGYYRFNLWLYRRLGFIYKYISNKFIYRLCGLNKFLKENSNIELDNGNNSVRYKSAEGKYCNYSLDKVYNESLRRAFKYINEINKYLTNV